MRRNVNSSLMAFTVAKLCVLCELCVSKTITLSHASGELQLKHRGTEVTGSWLDTREFWRMSQVPDCVELMDQEALVREVAEMPVEMGHRFQRDRFLIAQCRG